MSRSLQSSRLDSSERRALHNRVQAFYAHLNREHWDQCFAMIDPQLTQQGKVKLAAYAQRLAEFKAVYGLVRPWFTRLSLHLGAKTNRRDSQPFAYVYVIWQDASHAFHMFRERWVKADGAWFTRVVGLVANPHAGVEK